MPWGNESHGERHFTPSPAGDDMLSLLDDDFADILASLRALRDRLTERVFKDDISAIDVHSLRAALPALRGAVQAAEDAA